MRSVQRTPVTDQARTGGRLFPQGEASKRFALQALQREDKAFE